MPSNFILQAVLDQNNQSHFWPGPYPPTHSLIKLNNTIVKNGGIFNIFARQFLCGTEYRSSHSLSNSRIVLTSLAIQLVKGIKQ